MSFFFGNENTEETKKQEDKKEELALSN